MFDGDKKKQKGAIDSDSKKRTDDHGSINDSSIILYVVNRILKCKKHVSSGGNEDVK